MTTRLSTAIRLVAFSLLLGVPCLAPAQFNYRTNNGSIIITGYTGFGGGVTIPGTINDLPVTSIGDSAFYDALPGPPMPPSWWKDPPTWPMPIGFPW